MNIAKPCTDYLDFNIIWHCLCMYTKTMMATALSAAAIVYR